MLQIIQWQTLSVQQQEEVLLRPSTPNRASLQKTQEIIDAVRVEGDAALKRLTQLYDRVTLDNLRVNEAEFMAAEKIVNDTVERALKNAAANIEKFHQAQYPNNLQVTTSPGIECALEWRALARVGLYVPGGTASLPSTVLMLGIPAKIAQCPIRILCTPPRPDGSVDPNVLVAAKICGINQVYKIGGAQAIAAMAYGTESIPAVDKIFGPGNSWVAQAKLLVAQDAAGASFDLPAGPSEQMVIADKTANPAWVAADLLSQAEHGVDSQVILICDDVNFAEQVNLEIQKQIKLLPRREIIIQALAHGRTIIVADIETAIVISNRYAPEHLILQIKNPRDHIKYITAAGSVFLGPWAPESVGDYASGTNHVLPTYGYARNCSGLAVTDFMLRITFQELTQQGLVNLAPTVETLAAVEKLDAHRRAVSIRVMPGISQSTNAAMEIAHE